MAAAAVVGEPQESSLIFFSPLLFLFLFLIVTIIIIFLFVRNFHAFHDLMRPFESAIHNSARDYYFLFNSKLVVKKLKVFLKTPTHLGAKYSAFLVFLPSKVLKRYLTI